MQINKLKKKSKTDLEKELQKKRVELRKLRFNLAGMKLRDKSKIKKTKKDIAQILTVINQDK
jgi:ribosomal protein L29